MDYLFVGSKSIDFKVKVNSCSPTNRVLLGKSNVKPMLRFSDDPSLPFFAYSARLNKLNKPKLWNYRPNTKNQLF